MEEGRSVFKILTGTPRRVRIFGSSRRRWEDYIRINHKQIDIITRNWVDSTQDEDF